MFLVKSFAGCAAAGALMLSSATLAADPVQHSLNVSAANLPSEAIRALQADVQPASSLSERFGLNGPLPLPAARRRPAFDTPDNAWPPAIHRARKR